MESLTFQTHSANLTEEQFFLLCSDNRDLRIERDKDKNILIMAPTGSSTGNFNSEILRALGNWNSKLKNGYTFDSSSGFTLPNSAVRSPDTSWIEKSRWEKISKEDQEKFAHICPDFVIEIFSKSDSLPQLNKKMEEWIENGCQLGWLINPYEKTTSIYFPNTEIEIVSFDKPLYGKNVLPGFELVIAQVL
ncbi:MAG: Uma2 family endonuclease [Bacteroidia bacterium]|nr:Uma2 family endonuclease [Bacteroidia bacterium]